MSNVAIKVENLGKRYLIDHQASNGNDNFREMIINNTKKIITSLNLFGQTPQDHSTQEEFWALKNVSFEIEQGDRVGIIGRNGAGKSTLLKILSRITEPTKGRIHINGRIASLLEVGTGFHPELTGRENIYLNGAILGMSRAEIRKKFDEIVAFAEIEKFLDTPVKRYSSGMYVRLAFSVAAHLEPEILIVDEVLAVGDIEFQKKCMGKMGEVSQEGRTVLFVSHNISAITNLCNKSLVLNKGTLAFKGTALEACNHYLQDHQSTGFYKEISPVIADNKVSFLAARLTDTDGTTITSISIHEPFDVEMTYSVGKNMDPLQIPNFHFKTHDGIYAFVVTPPTISPVTPGIYKAKCHIPGNWLNDGIYSIGVAVTEHSKGKVNVQFYYENYLHITIVDDILTNPYRYSYGGKIPGVIRPMMEWTIYNEGGR